MNTMHVLEHPFKVPHVHTFWDTTTDQSLCTCVGGVGRKYSTAEGLGTSGKSWIFPW